MPVDSPEDLYGLPLDRFIPTRTALVKTLRAEKRREEASAVAALRKPSVAAWAVNRLVRTQPKGLQALFEAGDELARAQGQATAGKGGGDAMRGAARRQRDAMRVLLEAAEGLLSSEGQGLTSATMERVSETLRAAAVDEDARRQVARGCITHELQFVGVGLGAAAPPSVKDARNATAKPKGKVRSRDNEEGAHAKREAARQHAAALKAAQRVEAEARRAAGRAHKELTAAQVRREAAAASLSEAETLLLTAARRAEDAAAKLTAAEQALSNLGQPPDTAT